MIWPYPKQNKGGVGTVDPAGDLWPHQIRSWKYHDPRGWHSDSRLTVTGNNNFNILCIDIK